MHQKIEKIVEVPLSPWFNSMFSTPGGVNSIKKWFEMFIRSSAWSPGDYWNQRRLRTLNGKWNITFKQVTGKSSREWTVNGLNYYYYMNGMQSSMKIFISAGDLRPKTEDIRKV